MQRACPRPSACDIQWRSPDLICPECGTCSLNIHFVSELSNLGRLRGASCTICGNRFDAESLFTYDERCRDLLDLAAERRCTVCDAMHSEVRGLCDASARNCFFLMTCRSCGDIQLA